MGNFRFVESIFQEKELVSRYLSASVTLRFVDAIMSRFFTKARGVSRHISSFFLGDENDGDVMGSPFRHMKLVAVFDEVLDDVVVVADVDTDAGDTLDEN